MKKLPIVLSTLLVLVGCSFVFATKAKAAAPEYVYYDMDNWKRYLSTEVPDCRHDNIGYRFVEDDWHSIFCQDCGVIFTYEKCYIDNESYPSPSDYYHDRCQLCLHKKIYKYVPVVKDKSKRRYID